MERVDNPNDVEYYVYDSEGQRVRKVRETLIEASTETTPATIEIEEKIYLGAVEVKKIRRYTDPDTTDILARTSLHIMDDARRIAIVHNWSLDTTFRETDSANDLDVNKTRYQYGNHLDSSSLEVSSTGEIISYEEYFPYGGTSFIAGTNQKEVKLKEYRYTGKERDDSTGLYYYGARYYAPWVGRWLSCDPLFRENPMVYEKPKSANEDEKQKQEEEFIVRLYTEGLNLYQYVKGNPVRYMDSIGHYKVETPFERYVLMPLGEGFSGILSHHTKGHGYAARTDPYKFPETLLMSLHRIAMSATTLDIANDFSTLNKKDVQRLFETTFKGYPTLSGDQKQTFIDAFMKLYEYSLKKLTNLGAKSNIISAVTTEIIFQARQGVTTAEKRLIDITTLLIYEQVYDVSGSGYNYEVNKRTGKTTVYGYVIYTPKDIDYEVFYRRLSAINALIKLKLQKDNKQIDKEQLWDIESLNDNERQRIQNKINEWFKSNR